MADLSALLDVTDVVGGPISDTTDHKIAHATLMEWVASPGVAPTGDHLYACAKWPWCVRDDAPLPPGTAAQLPLLARWHDVTTTLRVAFDEPSLSAGEAVKEALVAVVPEEDRAKLRDGHFVLKATGWHEYFSCPSTPLWKFNYVYNCLRDQAAHVDVTAVALTPKEAALLWGPASTVRFNCGANLPPVLVPRQLRHSVEAFPLEKMTVPFRVRPIGIENLYGVPATAKVKLTFILACGGFTLDDTVLSSTLTDVVPESVDADADVDGGDAALSALAVGDGSVEGSVAGGSVATGAGEGSARQAVEALPCFARWSDDMLSTAFDVSTLPTAARVIVALSVVGPPAALDEKRIACVALPLFDESRRLRHGRWALRMFKMSGDDGAAVHSVATRASGRGADSDHSDGEGHDTSAPAPATETADLANNKASLIGLFPLHVACGVSGENETEEDSPVVMFQLDRYLLPVEAPSPDFSRIQTSASDIGHSMSIVKLDPARPSVVSVKPRGPPVLPTGPVPDPPPAPPAPVPPPATDPSPTEPPSAPTDVHGSSMLMVSSAIRKTRRTSMHPALAPGGATALASAAAAAAASSSLLDSTPLPPAAPVIVPVTDTLDKAEVHLLSDILSRDPLSIRLGYTQPERRLLWKVREDLTGISSALPKLLRCVSWHRTEQRAIVHDLLKRWMLLDPEHALQLLDASYADELARAFAVRCLDSTSDDELFVFLLPLIQALKYEPFVDSYLARTLLRRALWNPHDIGVPLFWLLKSEQGQPGFGPRCTVLMHVLLTQLGPFLPVIATQAAVNAGLEDLARQINLGAREKRRTTAESTAFARAKLVELSAALPPTFTLPLSSHMMCRRLNIDRCKVMDSKQAPLWLEFENADPHGRAVKTLYKAGDDLRQDLLTLQLIRTMSELWLSKGLHLPTQIYQCVCTGNETGMIEIVQGAETTSSIQSKAGVLLGAWAKRPIVEYLQSHNEGSSAYDEAVSRFVRSCAGYCVATFVLGVGDRHPSNIMVTHDGNLFHIDFGHFLGNFKTKTVGGITVRRERAPFVFTPQMAQVMKEGDSNKYSEFESRCVDAYNIVREHGFLFLSYFVAMLPAGLPELASETDINYLREKLAVEATDLDAADQFKREIENSLASVSRQLDNMAHLTKHARG